MQTHYYKRTEAKFSLWASRVVWDETLDAMVNRVIDEVVEAEKTKAIMADDAAKLKGKVEKKLGDNKEAIGKLDTLMGRLEAFAALVRLRTKTNVALEAISINNKNVKIADWIAAMEKLEPARMTLLATFTDADSVVATFDAKKRSIVEMQGFSKQKIAYYNGILDEKPEAPSVDRLNDNYASQLFAWISRLEAIRANNFEYLDEADKPGMETAYNTALGNARKGLLTGSYTLTADEQASLKNMEDTAANMDAAQRAAASNSPEGLGHLAGAKERQKATWAEQEARDVWNSLANLDGTMKFGESVAAEEANKLWSAPYNAGIESFNTALLAFRMAKGNGKWGEATEGFNLAKALWSQVLAQKNAEIEASEGKKSKERLQKNAFESAKLIYNQAMEVVERLDNTDVAKMSTYKADCTAIEKHGNSLNIQDPALDYTSADFVTSLPLLLANVKKYETLYKEFTQKTLPGRMDAAMNHMAGEIAKGNFQVAVGVVVNDYVGAQNFRGFENELLEVSSGMVLRGAYERKSRNNLIKRESVVAINRSGSWDVSKTVQGGVDAEVKLITRQEALNFAKEKAKAAFSQQDNQDKAEAIEDYILDMREWRSVFGSERRAKEVYLKMLEGEEFDVQNSNLHVKIVDGKVRVTEKPSQPVAPPTGPSTAEPVARPLGRQSIV